MEFKDINVVNTINGQINKQYNANLPYVTKNNFSDMADQLLSNPPEVINSWIHTLLNVVGKQVNMNKEPIESYFRKLYKPDTETENIQLTMVDLIPAKVYSPDSNAEEFFEDAKAEIGTQYIQSVLKEKFPLTVNEDVLRAAFISTDNFNNMLEAQMARMLDSAESYNMENVEVVLDKNLYEGNFYIMKSARPVDKETSLAFTNKVKFISEDMKIKNTNKYNLSHFYTHVPASDGVVMATTDSIAATETYSLAWAFNKDLLSLQDKGQFITISSDGLAGGKVFGAYIDKDVLQLRRKKGFPKAVSQYFGNTLSYTQWYHVQEVLAVSFFNNAVFFAAPEDVGIASAVLGTKNGSSNVNRDSRTDIYVKTVTAESGKIADKFGKFSVVGLDAEGESVVLADGTFVDENNGRLYVAKNETAKTLKVTWTSHIDEDVTATIDITVNGN